MAIPDLVLTLGITLLIAINCGGMLYILRRRRISVQRTYALVAGSVFALIAVSSAWFLIDIKSSPPPGASPRERTDDGGQAAPNSEPPPTTASSELPTERWPPEVAEAAGEQPPAAFEPPSTTAGLSPPPEAQFEQPMSGFQVLASRIFAGPDQYPPGAFAAYGILAFRSFTSSQDRFRRLFICEAYSTSLPHASQLNVAHSEQMVTVWPIDTDEKADALNRISRNKICSVAVDRYGLVTALQALKDAELAGVRIAGIGPVLLAWSPSGAKGKQDALVLVSDLSNVTTFRQAQEIFLKWSREIEQNPQLWRSGWNLEKLRTQIRLWVDQYGPQILALFGAKE